MKRVIGLLLLAFGITAGVQAQNLPVDESTGKITYIEKVQATGMSAKQIYDVVKEWAAAEGYQIESDEANKLKFNVKLTVYYPKTRATGEDKGYVNCRLIVGFKDGKYRIIVTDFVHVADGKTGDGGKLEATQAACGPTKMSAKAWVTIKNRTSTLTQEMLAKLMKRVKEVQNNPENNDDW